MKSKGQIQIIVILLILIALGIFAYEGYQRWLAPKEIVSPEKYQECVNDNDCKEDETCENHICQRIVCGYCEFIENRQCKDYECCSDFNCDDNNPETLDKCIDPRTKNSRCEHEIVKKCDDDTIYGQCSTNKPKYCDNGNLIDKCSVCGCPSGQQCQADGSCRIEITPQCISGHCCDTSTNIFLTSTHKCQENIATEYGCPWGNDPGSDVGVKYQDRYCSGLSADCDGALKWSDWTISNDCTSNEACVNGVCTSLTCPDGTLYDQCSTDKPKYCDNGTLINKCSICGCGLDQICQVDGICKQTEQVYEVPLLVLRYFPDEDDDGRLDPGITGMNEELTTVRAKVDSLTSETIFSLEAGSSYHDYKDTAATPSLDYYIIDTKEFLQRMPLSNNEVPWNPGIYRPDYEGILNDLDICNYVDSQGVREVWIWGYHYGDLEPTESNMAMATISQAHWNFPDYGDVSNSERINDMPICNRTYVLYNYNYDRGLGEALEDHTHQIEAVFNFVDCDLFWNRFVNPYGPGKGITHCGWTHYPPNGRSDYDWMNEEGVESNCEDWHPDGSGETKQVNCYTWGDHSCPDDAGVSFKIWWMQNIPGKNNNLYFEGKNLRNWWDFIGDFDQGVRLGRNLTY